MPIDECAPMVWGHGEQAEAAVDELFRMVSPPAQWQQQVFSARDAVAQAMAIAADAARPVVIADTQDNPGAGGDIGPNGSRLTGRWAGHGYR